MNNSDDTSILDTMMREENSSSAIEPAKNKPGKQSKGAKKHLVIVESPAKARTISQFLGPRYKVTASMGHVRDLPEYKLGVDIDNNFEPQYIISKKKESFIKQLVSDCKNAENIYFATDPDREGESISWHLAQTAKLNKKPINRIVFHEITRDAIEEAIKNPKDIDMDMVNAQQARRVLDRLVGYKLSPLLWKKIQKGLSAGRVQSVALKMVVDRTREVTAFVPREYWLIEAFFVTESGQSLKALLVGTWENDHLQKLSMPNETEARSVASQFISSQFNVQDIQVKPVKYKPGAPFTTSTLQQEAYRKLRYSAKKTMALAQQLYEGVDVQNSNTGGLITYMRTDSTTISTTALNDIRNEIEKKFGSEFLHKTVRTFKTKTKGAQEAHEAIRPTSIERSPESLRISLSKDAIRLYDLIWKRTIASQMSDAVHRQTVALIRNTNGTGKTYIFRATANVLEFKGFKAAYTLEDDDPNDDQSGTSLSTLKENDILTSQSITPNQHFTEPPPLFTEGTLIKALEENGIGRPSTYVPTLSAISERGYVEKSKGRFSSLELGEVVTDQLVSHFPLLLSEQFTASMEEQLDGVAKGSQDWQSVLQEFYAPFSLALETAIASMPSLKTEEATDEECSKCGSPMVIKNGRNGKFMACSAFPKCRNAKPVNGEEPIQEATDEECSKCGSPMVIKNGRNGKFIACSAFPKCRNTKPLEGEEPVQEATDEECSKCGSPMVIKNGRNGKFMACSAFPKCRNAKPIKKQIGVPCPQCGEELNQLETRGRIFYGCSNYPTCKFTTPQKPLPEPCPECNGLLTMISDKGAQCISCAFKELDYSTGTAAR